MKITVFALPTPIEPCQQSEEQNEQANYCYLQQISPRHFVLRETSFRPNLRLKII